MNAFQSTSFQQSRPRVAIVGAGFAGLNAARALGDAPVEVVLIDQKNYHNFQPLMYQVATAGLGPDDIVHPLRDIFQKNKNVRFLLGTVEDVHLEEQQLALEDGPPVAYDYLILAAGAITSYFGVDGAAEHAFSMKTVPQAVHLRNHILYQFERCERDSDEAGEGALTFVLVGAGPSGVELAGQLAELSQRVLLDDYRHIDPRQARIVLLEMVPHVLPGYDSSLQGYTQRELERRGVEVRTETTVASVRPEAVELENGETIPAQTLIWTGGVQAHPLANAVGTEQSKGGRLLVEQDLSLPGHPDVFVAGDLSACEDEAGEYYAQLATVAIQQGRHAAKQVLRQVEGKSREPFDFEDPGIMATIGRASAVAQFPGGLRLRGFVAWLLWAFVHVYQLVGFENRLRVFMDWVYNYLTFDFNNRFILDDAPSVQRQEAQDDGKDQASSSSVQSHS